MRKTFLLFLSLVIVFFGTWAFKYKNPSLRPKSYAAEGNPNSASWWMDEDGNRIRPVSDDWKIDPEIPLNYKPVPGQNELYMVVDDSGYIIGYRQRIKQDDGSWVWKDVNPDIPENYEAVEGLEDVYKVTMEDGSIKYYKYIRNKDDTFAFVEVDENGNEVELVNNDNSGEIPDNYINEEGNLFGVYNENGVLIGHKQREQQDDGSFKWVTVNPDDFLKASKDGLKSVTSNDLLTDNGIRIDLPVKPSNNASRSPYIIHIPDVNKGNQVSERVDEVISSGGQTPSVYREKGEDGAYTETETLTETEVSGGYRITYETKIHRVYNSLGILQSTKKEGPFEIAREKDIINSGGIETIDPTRIESTLDGEVARVSSKVNIHKSIANEVLNKLNAERSLQGLASLSMDESSNSYKIALIKAADMAINDYSDFSSPLYGALSDILIRYDIASAMPSENVWKTSPREASEIHTRFQTIESSRAPRLNANYTNVGIAVCELNGYYYICEIYLN